MLMDHVQTDALTEKLSKTIQQTSLKTVEPFAVLKITLKYTENK